MRPSPSTEPAPPARQLLLIGVSAAALSLLLFAVLAGARGTTTGNPAPTRLPLATDALGLLEPATPMQVPDPSRAPTQPATGAGIEAPPGSDPAVGTNAADPDLAALRKFLRERSDQFSPHAQAGPELPWPSSGSPAATLHPDDGGPRAASRRRPPIPDRLEGTLSSTRHGDALADLHVEARLLLIDGGPAPLQLFGIQADVEQLRADLRPVARDSEVGAAAPLWLGVGGSPLPGWLLVAIEPHAVTLLSPLGNLVRIHPSAPANLPSGTNGAAITGRAGAAGAIHG